MVASGSGDGLRGGLQGAPPAWEKHGARREQEGCCHRAGGMASWSQEGPGEGTMTRRDIVGWGQKGPGRTFLEIQDPGGMASWGQGGPERSRNSWRSRRDITVGTGRSRRDVPGDPGGTSPWGEEQHCWRMRRDVDMGPRGLLSQGGPGGTRRDTHKAAWHQEGGATGREHPRTPQRTGKRQRGDGEVARGDVETGDVPACTLLRGFEEVASLLYRPSGRC